MAANQMFSLLLRSRAATRWPNQQLAEVLGVSLRTTSRILCGESDVTADMLLKLAPHVHPVDRGLASELAGMSGKTLVDVGLESSHAQQRMPAPASMPAAPVITREDLIDAIVCAAAEAADLTPKAVRPTVLLTLRRARKLGLDLEAAGKAGSLGSDEAPLVLSAHDGAAGAS